MSRTNADLAYLAVGIVNPARLAVPSRGQAAGSLPIVDELEPGLRQLCC